MEEFLMKMRDNYISEGSLMLLELWVYFGYNNEDKLEKFINWFEGLFFYWIFEIDLKIECYLFESVVGKYDCEIIGIERKRLIFSLEYMNVLRWNIILSDFLMI